MKRALKIIVILFALIILIGGSVVAYLVATLDTEQVKQQLSSAVLEQTGRQLMIKGDLELSVFPWVGFKIGSTQFANRAGFKGDFARFEKAEARVKLMPLFSKQVEMSKLIIDGFNLNLQLGEDGSNNWADLSKPAKGKPEATASSSSPAAAAGGVGLLLEGVEIRNAGIHYQDAVSKAAYALTDFNLTTGRIEPGRDIPFEVAFGLDLSEPAVKGTYQLSGVLLFDQAFAKLSLRDLELVSDLKAEKMPFNQLHSELTASLKLDQQTQALLVEPFKLNVDVQGDELPKSPLSLSFASVVNANLKTLAVNLDKMNLTLPAGVLQGAAAYKTKGEKQLIDFDLSSEQLDLNQLMPPAGENAAASESGSKPVSAKAAQANPALRKLVVNGDLQLARVLVDKLKVEEVKVHLRMRDGVARLNPITAKVYEGLVQKDVSIDLREAAPKISAKAEIKGFQVGEYLQAAMDKDLVSGIADLQADLRMTVADADSIKQSLNGTVNFIARDGALKGVNIPDLIRRAKAALSGKTIPPASVQKTDFSELSGSAKITNGLVNNPDLSMKSPLLRIDGKGTVHLVQEKIDYRVTANLVSSIAGQGGEDLKDLVGVPLPIHITGSFAKPDWKIDLTSALKEKARAEAEGILNKALENPEKSLSNPKELLDDPEKQLKGLKGLFN